MSGLVRVGFKVALIVFEPEMAENAIETTAKQDFFTQTFGENYVTYRLKLKFDFRVVEVSFFTDFRLIF